MPLTPPHSESPPLSQDSIVGFVNKVALPPPLIQGIVQAPPQSDEFLAAVIELGEKLKLAAADAELKGTVALKWVEVAADKE